MLELIKIISLLTLSSILIGAVLNRLFNQKTDFGSSLFQYYLSGMIIIYLAVLTGVPLSFLLQFLLYFREPLKTYHKIMIYDSMHVS